MDEVRAKYAKAQAQKHGYEYIPRITINNIDIDKPSEDQRQNLDESMRSFLDRHQF